MGAAVATPVTFRREPPAISLHRLAAKGHGEGLRILDDLSAAPFACRVPSSRPGHFPYVVNLARVCCISATVRATPAFSAATIGYGSECGLAPSWAPRGGDDQVGTGELP